MSDHFSSPPPVSFAARMWFAVFTVVVAGACLYVWSVTDPSALEEAKKIALYGLGGLILYVVGWYFNRWLGFPMGRRYDDYHATSWKRYEDSHYEPEHPFDFQNRPREDAFGGYRDSASGDWYPTATGRTELDRMPSPFDAVERWKCGFCGGWNPEEREKCLKCSASYDDRVLTSVEKAEQNSRRKKRPD